MKNNIISTLLLFATLFFNYMNTSWNWGVSNEVLSETFPFMFMPPGWTFMWARGVIYLLLIVYVAYGRIRQPKKWSAYQATQSWFWGSCLLNSLRITASGQWWHIVSVVLIFMMRWVLANILDLISSKILSKDDQSASQKKETFRSLRVPFGIYYGRISLASSVLWLSQAVALWNVDITMSTWWILFVLIIGLFVIVLSRKKRKNYGQILISIRAIIWIFTSLFG